MAAVGSTPFVGREKERAAYQRLLCEDAAWLLLISGQSGYGKSALLKRLRAETPIGWRVGLLDFDPEEGLATDALRVGKELAEWLRPLVTKDAYTVFAQEYKAAQALLTQQHISLQNKIEVGADADVQGLSQSINTGGIGAESRRQARDQVTDALLDLATEARGRQLVLLLDTCEWFHELLYHDTGTWLLRYLLPRLRERLEGGLRVVAAGRERLETLLPDEGAQPISLELLSFEELEPVLSQLGMQDAALRRAVYEMTRGHPLCVNLVVQLWQEPQGRALSSNDLPAFQGVYSALAVIAWVVERILSRMQPPQSDLIKYGVLLRSFDLPLLRAVFPEWMGDDDAIFLHLIRSSLITLLTSGCYAFHDLLRQVQADYVRQQLPEKWRMYHERALSFWNQHPEQVWDQHLPPPDYFYHWLALQEGQGAIEWADKAQQTRLLGEKDYWERFLQAAYDTALAPNPLFQATRAFEQGQFFHYQAQWDSAVESYQQALRLFQQIGYLRGQANTWSVIGIAQGFQDDYRAALQSHKKALALFQKIGDQHGEATTYKSLGDDEQFLGHIQAALAYYERALPLIQRTPDRLGQANIRKAMGDIQSHQGNTQGALVSYQEALSIFQEINSRLGQANCYFRLGVLAYAQGDIQRALDLEQEAYQRYQLLGNQYGQMQALAARAGAQNKLLISA